MATIDDLDRIAHLEKLKRDYESRLQARESTRAKQGFETEPHILMEIEDLQIRIRQVTNELVTLRQALYAPLPAELVILPPVSDPIFLSHSNHRPTIGIIVALPLEHAAVRAVFNNLFPIEAGEDDSLHTYYLGIVQNTHRPGQGHIVVLDQLTIMGTNQASVQATQMLSHFETIQTVIMVGIAGGIPAPDNLDKHVRLGDVVVSDSYGIIEYDYKKKVAGIDYPRPRANRPDERLLHTVQQLLSNETLQQRPWLEWIDLGCKQLHVRRPRADRLYGKRLNGKGQEEVYRIRHRRDNKRRSGQPRIFLGPIGSANTLLRDAQVRDQLKEDFKLLAVEMEGIGIVSAVWLGRRGYLVVRGISDYCDEHKDDSWQEYAAICAAAFTRAILEHLPGKQIPQLFPRRISSNAPDQYRIKLLIATEDLQKTTLEIREIFTREKIWSDQCQRAQFEHLPSIIEMLDGLDAILNMYPVSSDQERNRINDLAVIVFQKRENVAYIQSLIATLAIQPDQSVSVPSKKREQILRVLDRLVGDWARFGEL